MLPSTVLGVFKYYSIKLNKALLLTEFIFQLGKPKVHKLSKHIMSDFDNFYEQKQSRVREKEEHVYSKGGISGSVGKGISEDMTFRQTPE